MRDEIKRLAMAVEGFLSEDEGLRLFALAAEVSPRAPCLEIGSYCGRSTLFLAEGCRVGGRYPLFAVDHHRGSPEQQPGQAYFDPAHLDATTGGVDTLAAFMGNLRRAELTDWVAPVIYDSQRLSESWPHAALGLVFIDGGHSAADAFGDFHGWSGRVAAGGYVAIHDVHADPRQGGQAPFEVVQYALHTGRWELVDQVDTLAVLRRCGADTPAAGKPAGAVTLRSARCLGPVPPLRAGPWAMIGQDGGQSIDLGDATLFVFSDTLLNAPRSGRTGHGRPLAPAALPREGVFLANCAGVSAGRTLRAALAELHYFTDEAGLPREVLPASAEERAAGLRFWPEHGLCVAGQVFLFYLGIETTDPTSVWGFRTVGTGLAVLDPRTGACERLRPAGDWRLLPTGDEDAHFGVQVLREGDTAYVFGSVRDGWQATARLARVPVEQLALPSAYEYLTSTTPTWGRDPAQACDLGVSGPEFSVSFNPHLGRYTLLTVDGFRKALLLRTAEAVHGPYSPPQTLIGLPHAPASELVYLGFEHPKFRDGHGEVVNLSYSQPHFSPNSLLQLRFR